MNKAVFQTDKIDFSSFRPSTKNRVKYELAVSLLPIRSSVPPYFVLKRALNLGLDATF